MAFIQQQTPRHFLIYSKGMHLLPVYYNTNVAEYNVEFNSM